MSKIKRYERVTARCMVCGIFAKYKIQKGEAETPYCAGCFKNAVYTLVMGSPRITFVGNSDDAKDVPFIFAVE